MKKILSFLWIMATMFAVSCQKENEVKDEPLTFSKVKIAIGDEGLDTESGTKSLISVDTEDFVDAYLFAFDASTKKILTYNDGTPVSMYTNSKEFDWNLPINKAIDLWVACNTGSSNTWKTAFENAYVNPNLTENSIYGDNLMFVCQTSADLIKLQTTGAGIPMSGMMNDMTISSPTSIVTITVKRLFAKYQFKVIPEGLEDSGLYEVNSVYITSSKSNTQCPFFYNGHYAQTDASKLGVIDYATSTDLVTADAEGYVTLYYLENAQGNKTKPDDNTKWYNVVSKYGESAMSLCSNVKIGVNIHNNQMGVDQNIGYTVYLGKTDMVTNFDVQRNYLKKVKLNLKIDTPPAEEFKFTNTSPIEVAPGSTVDIPFETTLNVDSEVTFTTLENIAGITKVYTASVSGEPTVVKNGSKYYVRISVASTVPEGNYTLKGGRLSGNEISDICPILVKVTNPLITNNIIMSSVRVLPNNRVEIGAYWNYPVLTPFTVRCMANGVNLDFTMPITTSGGHTLVTDFITQNTQYTKAVNAGITNSPGVTPSYCYGSADDDTYHYNVQQSTMKVYTGALVPSTKDITIYVYRHGSQPWKFRFYTACSESSAWNNLNNSTNQDANKIVYIRVKDKATNKYYNIWPYQLAANDSVWSDINCVYDSNNSSSYYYYPLIQGMNLEFISAGIGSFDDSISIKVQEMH